MFNFNIVPLAVDDIDRICDDIEELVRSGVITMPLFSMTLVPEGDPPVDKARELTERFKLFQDRLVSRGLRGGVLLQSTLGHGYILNARNPFQNYIGMMDEEERQVCCPLDKGVQEHFYRVCRTIASAGPAFMLVDDDFRLIARSGHGCACPLHMAEFERLTGLKFTIPELRERLNGTSDEDRRLAEIFDRMQCDSLVNMAKVMRRGIDDEDPSIRGGYCPCSGDIRHALPVARAFAGQGNPVLIRINCGFYNQPGPRYFSGRMLSAAVQLAAVRDEADIVLTESDTCPQNRYSTCASTLHAHYSASLLEGCDGAKHWISRHRGREWQSAAAYRKVLREHQGFYRKLEEFGKTARWCGARFALPEKPYFDYNPVGSVWGESWHQMLLERLGIPMYFSRKPGGAVFMNGLQPRAFADRELEKLLSGALFLDGQAAELFCQRGFGELLGVRVKPWTLPRATGEILPEGSTGPQENLRELELQGAEADSKIYHAAFNQSSDPEFIAPGCTVFRNGSGGTVTVFAGSPPGTGLAGFSFLCENRKRQLVRLIGNSAGLPVYYTGDSAVYMRAGALPDASFIAVLFNLSLDQLDTIELHVERPFRTLEYLTAAGNWEKADFRNCGGGNIDAALRFETFRPRVLRLT